MSKVKPHRTFDSIFWVDNKLATENLVPGIRVYGEKLVRVKDKEYRIWDARRSKPAAAIYKNLHHFPLKKGMKILYLGFASATTGSHFSDIIGKKGLIYGIEISERTLRDALTVAKERSNMVPILADGRKPEEYSWVEEVDLVYADIAIPDMSQVFIRNAKMFLKEDGFGMIAIKSRSIDVTEKPSIVYKKERKKLEEFFNVTDFVTLQPYERDHGFFVLKRKNI